MLLTVDELREHVTTTIGDEALQRIMDFNETAIDKVAGALGQELTEIHYTNGYESILLLRHFPDLRDSPPSPVVVQGWGLTSQLTLEDDDWRLDGATLRRIDFGTNPGVHFESPVAVRMFPRDDYDLRVGVLIQLCNLEVTTKPGLRAFTVGKRREEYASAASGGTSYAEDREAILATLLPSVPLFA